MFIWKSFQPIFIFRTELSEARILHEKVQHLLYGNVEINGLKKKTEDIERFKNLLSIY